MKYIRTIMIMEALIGDADQLRTYACVVDLLFC